MGMAASCSTRRCLLLLLLARELTAEGDIFSQRVALFVQDMASTLVTSGISETGLSMAGHLDGVGLSNSFIAQPIQQHSRYA